LGWAGFRENLLIFVFAIIKQLLNERTFPLVCSI
jgi:hypothetical protein